MKPERLENHYRAKRRDEKRFIKKWLRRHRKTLNKSKLTKDLTVNCSYSSSEMVSRFDPENTFEFVNPKTLSYKVFSRYARNTIEIHVGTEFIKNEAIRAKIPTFIEYIEKNTMVIFTSVFQAMVAILCAKNEHTIRTVISENELTYNNIPKLYWDNRSVALDETKMKNKLVTFKNSPGVCAQKLLSKPVASHLNLEFSSIDDLISTKEKMKFTRQLLVELYLIFIFNDMNLVKMLVATGDCILYEHMRSSIRKLKKYPKFRQYEPWGASWADNDRFYGGNFFGKVLMDVRARCKTALAEYNIEQKAPIEWILV